MVTDAPAFMACPHCGGAIKPAAKVCKHCKHPVGDDPSAPVATLSAPSPSPEERGRLRRDLQQFLSARGIVSRDAFEAVAAGHADDDAAALLGRLAVAGHVTPAQVESLREAFLARQDERLGRLIAAASRRELLTSAQAAAARTGFAPVAFAQTPEHYLVASGCLTTAQVVALRGAAALPFRVRVRTDPELRRTLAAGPGAMALVSVGFVAALTALPTLGVAWASLYLIPVVAVLAVAWESSAWRARLGWLASTVATGVVVTALASTVWDHVHPRPPLALDPNCTMDGRGNGECVFTNLGGPTTSGCGVVVVTCRPANGNSDTRTSPSFCSGSLGPGETRVMGFYVAEFDLIRDRAVPYGSDWRRYCSFDWEAQ